MALPAGTYNLGTLAPAGRGRGGVAGPVAGPAPAPPQKKRKKEKKEVKPSDAVISELRRKEEAIEEQQRLADEAIAREHAEAAKLADEQLRKQRKLLKKARQKQQFCEAPLPADEQQRSAVEESRRQQEAAKRAREAERAARLARQADEEEHMEAVPAEARSDKWKGKTRQQILAAYMEEDQDRIRAEKLAQAEEDRRLNFISEERMRQFSDRAAEKMADERRLQDQIDQHREFVRQRAEEKKRRKEHKAMLAERRRQRDEAQSQKDAAAVEAEKQRKAQLAEEAYEKRVADLEKQLRLDMEARTRAEESQVGILQAQRKEKEEEERKISEEERFRMAELGIRPVVKRPEDVFPERVVDDAEGIRRMFGTIPSLPPWAPQRAACAGKACCVDEEKPDGTVLLRFPDGFTSWFPRLVLEGAMDALPPPDRPDSTCDVCNTVCCSEATDRERLCGDLQVVYRIYQDQFREGNLPHWNPRKVPNPRRAHCPGQEVDIIDEDPVRELVRLRFPDHFNAWFPRRVLQSEKCRMQASVRERQREEQKQSSDVHGFRDCIPDTRALHQPTQPSITPREWEPEFNRTAMPAQPTQSMRLGRLAERSGWANLTRDRPLGRLEYQCDDDDWGAIADRQLHDGSGARAAPAGIDDCFGGPDMFADALPSHPTAGSFAPREEGEAPEA